jgi:hypothetical protein
MVESVKARQEKAVRRSRVTLEAKVEEQREALKAIKATVDAFLVALTPEAGITPETTPVLTSEDQSILEELQAILDDPATVVLDPSAAA